MATQSNEAKYADLYKAQFGTFAKTVVCAPGRVEILGNHTDYNDGYVLTAAIDKHIYMAGEDTDSDQVRLYTQTLDDECTFDIFDVQKDDHHPWANYVKGVLHELLEAGITLSGFQAVIGGDLPVGGGVSSSAALESATAMLMQSLFYYELSKPEIATLCRRAENQFVGMPCGVLDQMSSILGKQDAMLFIDCRSLEYKQLELPPPAPDIVICNTNVKHNLVESQYKTRREQCFAAAEKLSGFMQRDILFLRDISAEELMPHLSELPEEESLRAWHVVSENERVCQGRDAIEKEDAKALGLLMFQSHESSKTLFQNSCYELDVLIEEARAIEGCLGAKLSGGGFGGCTVNLVEPDYTATFCKEIEARYLDQTQKPCSVMMCHIADGAGVLF